MATVTVSNVSQLMAALNNATGNTTIKMAAGNYNNLYISGNKIPELSNTASVTLTSADPNNAATITNMIMIGTKNVTFDGIDFDYTAANGASVGTRPFMILDSDNITVKNSTFDGDLSRGVAATENGYGNGIALGVKGTSNLTVADNTFTLFHKAVVVENGKNIDVLRNDISGMASDGVNFAGVSNVNIVGNHIHDFASHPGTAAHKDMIQFWANGNTAPSTNVVIKDNILNSGAGTWTQSILLFTNNGTTFSDFQITDNLIHNAFTHGITLDTIKNVVIQNNTILHNADSGVNGGGLYVPKIHIGGQVQNATVKDNITHGITGTKWSGSGNLIVQNTNPNQANYYGDLFVNGLAGASATVADLTALPGSVVDTSNVGAQISQPGNNALSTNGPNALLLSQEGNELSKGTVDFDISKITDGGSNVNTTGAKVSWDFGDGSTGSGLAPSHHYTHAGSYKVTANVTLKDGTKITSTKQLDVDTPIAIASDFEKGAVDQSDLVNTVKTSGAVQFINDQGSKVAKLGANGVITYGRSPELFDNTAYTVLADFRKDNLGDEGKLISFTNSFVIQVKQGAIYASVSTNKGTQWISKNVSVNDTNWHKLALTFSSTKGTVDLYLDGQKIGGLTGLKGAVQVGNQRHDFHVGSNTGGSFPGLVDNVSFLTGDLSASDVKSLHAGNTTVGNLLGTVLNSGGSGSVSTPTTNVTTSTPTDTGTDTGSSSQGSSSTPTQQAQTPVAPSTNTASTNGQTAISSDFQSGYKDQSASSNGTTAKGVKIVTDQGSKVVKLSSNSVLTYKDSPDMFNNKAYTVMADFRKDHASDEGKLITFANSFVVQVKDDMLSVSVTTNKGTKWINTKAPVDDTNWHKVALTFDSGSGRADLYLDGKVIGSITGLKGATQVGHKSQDFHVGSPWGGSFDGLVDNVAFLTNDLSASEIKSIHSGASSVPTSTSGTGSSSSGGTPAPTTTGGSTNGGSTGAVNGQAAIAADYQKGYTDQSASSNSVSTKNGASIVNDQGSKVVKLGDRTVVTYKDSPDMFNNKAYTVMADFRKDHKSDEGKLITFADSFVVQVKDDLLMVSVTTNKGTKWIKAKAPVDDTSWHKVALTFDSGSGRADLYLDGKVIGGLTGLKGATQVGNKSQDFHVGSPWGGSFDGLVDNVAFLTNDLSASEIKSIHSGASSIPNGGSSGSSGTSSSGSTSTPHPTAADSGHTNASGSFSYTMTAKNTKVSLDNNAKQGIIDQSYLSGDTANTFNVKVIDTASTAHFNNVLGVYEIDSKGRIVDVRILDKNAQDGAGTLKVGGVEKGHDLGFFIVQDGYNRLDNSVLNATNLSLVVKSGDVYLKKGSAVLNDKVYVSHNKNLNSDNQHHVTSMDNPNSNGAIITFEDQHKGGRDNDLTDVVFEVTAVGADELSFA